MISFSSSSRDIMFCFGCVFGVSIAFLVFCCFMFLKAAWVWLKLIIDGAGVNSFSSLFGISSSLIACKPSAIVCSFSSILDVSSISATISSDGLDKNEGNVVCSSKIVFCIGAGSFIGVSFTTVFLLYKESITGVRML